MPWLPPEEPYSPEPSPRQVPDDQGEEQRDNSLNMDDSWSDTGREWFPQVPAWVALGERVGVTPLPVWAADRMAAADSELSRVWKNIGSFASVSWKPAAMYNDTLEERGARRPVTWPSFTIQAATAWQWTEQAFYGPGGLMHLAVSPGWVRKAHVPQGPDWGWGACQARPC